MRTLHRFILASGSPQRRLLLQQLDFPFEVIPSTVDESGHPETNPAKRSQDLAALKARDVASKHSDAVVLGSDTLVVSPMGALLEKPADESDARRMIWEQSGGVSVVHSAIHLITPEGRELDALSSSRVHFKTLDDVDVDWWISTGLWEGRSGSFQIDGPGQLMIAHLEGDFTGVVGLPMFLLGQLLKDAGITYSA